MDSKDENEWTDEERQKFKAMVPHYEELLKDGSAETPWEPVTEASMAMDKAYDHITNADYADHFTNVDQVPYFPPEFLNYNVNWRKTKAFPDENLVHFFKPTHEQYRSSFAEVYSLVSSLYFVDSFLIRMSATAPASDREEARMVN